MGKITRFEKGKTTVGQLLDLTAEQFGGNKALIYPELGIDLTYNEFRKVCDNVAKGLMALGVKNDEKIAVWANNVPEWPFTFFGSAKAGSVVVPVNINYKEAEVEYMLGNSDSTTLFLMGGLRTPDEYLNMIYNLCPELKDSEPGKLKCAKLPLLRNVVFLGKEKHPGMFNWDDMLEMGKKISDVELKNREHSISPDDTMLISYTSGTTGNPKGAMLSHTNPIASCLSMSANVRLFSGDRMCIPVPFFTSFGTCACMVMCVLCATAMVPVVKFTPAAALELIEKVKCTAMNGVPTHLIMMLEEMKKKKYDTSSLRTGISAGSLCPEAVMKQVISPDGLGMTEVCNVYGQSETAGGVVSTNPEDSFEIKISSVGKILPDCEIKLIDPVTGEEVPRGTQGEICARAANVMKGFYKMPEATAHTIDKDKWLHTGDLGIMSQDGNLKITGRTKEMIIRGGVNVFPVEIEGFMRKHPKVKDVNVVGVPSVKYGEEIAAYIQMKEGETATEEEMKAFCSKDFAFHKVPSFFFFVNEYPMTASGKVQKFKLREDAVKRLGREDDAKVSVGQKEV
ncbi:MAG: AMP-binding protein [Smithellaceae bacterium]